MILLALLACIGIHINAPAWYWVLFIFEFTAIGHRAINRWFEEDENEPYT